MHVNLFKTFQFEAAHSNPQVTGAPSRLHGHSYRVDIQCAGECDPHLGWLIDYADISARFDPIYACLDHHNLNEIDGLTVPTRQNIVAWIHDQLKPDLTGLAAVHVAIVGDCAFNPIKMEPDPIIAKNSRIRFTFEAAHYLPNVPESHKCRRMHGHSFHVEIAASDLKSIETPLRALYDEIDHTCLNEFPGLENATSENVSRWIWDRLASHVYGLEAILVAETCTARCIYRGK